jgi:hypothetical protein
MVRPLSELTASRIAPNHYTEAMFFTPSSTTQVRLRSCLAPCALTWAVALGAAACGDDGADSPETESPTDGPSTSALEEKLSQCPTAQNTSDPTASACLEGTYEGTTFAGDACSLTIGDVGAFTFTSATLTVTSTPKEDSIFVFAHSAVGEFGQVGWVVSDPLSTEEWYELNFMGRYGETVPVADRKIEISVTRNSADARTSVTCTIQLE